MSRMTKIKICSITTIVIFFVLLIGALIVLVIPTFYLDSTILEIVCFFVIIIPLSFVLVISINFLGKKVLRKFQTELKIKKFDIFFSS